MTDTSGTYQRASVLEAARILGVSPTTVRRMVRAGTLRAERVLRPQGHTFVVLVPTDSQPAASSSQQVSAEARTEVPPSEQFASLAAAILTPVLAPILAEMAAVRQSSERKDDIIRELERENGELHATVATLQAQTTATAAPGSTGSPEPSTEPSSLWRRSPWLYGGVGISLLVVMLAIVFVSVLWR